MDFIYEALGFPNPYKIFDPQKNHYLIQQIL